MLPVGAGAASPQDEVNLSGNSAWRIFFPVFSTNPLANRVCVA